MHKLEKQVKSSSRRDILKGVTAVSVGRIILHPRKYISFS